MGGCAYACRIGIVDLGIWRARWARASWKKSWMCFRRMFLWTSRTSSGRRNCQKAKSRQSWPAGRAAGSRGCLCGKRPLPLAGPVWASSGWGARRTLRHLRQLPADETAGGSASPLAHASTFVRRIVGQHGHCCCTC